MRRNLTIAAVAGAALLTALPNALAATTLPNQAATNSGFAYASNQGIRICISGGNDQGTGQFLVEGQRLDTYKAAYALTPVLNPAHNATDTAGRCWDIDAPVGEYRVTPSKYLSANCLKTANGHIVQNPTGANPSGLEYTSDRCRAKVHHWHVRHDIFGSITGEPSVELPEGIEVGVAAGEVTRLDAHVTDERYPECTVGAAPAADPRICEPTGPTTS